MERIFFAIPLSNEFEAVMANAEAEMQDLPGKVKWVNPEKIHLTLKFVGDTEPEKIEELVIALKSLELPPPFDIKLNSSGIFPNPRRPRVLWIGIQDSEILSSLAQQMDEKLAEKGIERETRDFHPHLTLGRVKGRGLPGKTVDAFLNLDIPEKTMQVNSVICFKSDLKPSGAEYTALHEIKLNY